jgi:hypothetical protein
MGGAYRTNEKHVINVHTIWAVKLERKRLLATPRRRLEGIIKTDIITRVYNGFVWLRTRTRGEFL